MQQLNLAERSIIVTGAAGGLGQTLCRELVAAGARVSALVHTLDDGERLRDALGRPAGLRLVPADVTDEGAVDTAMAAAEDFAGELWGLVNVVGAYRGGHTVTETSLDDLEHLFAANLRSAFLCSRAALRRMASRAQASGRQHGGRIVNVGSALACRGQVGHFAYCATKAGLERLSEACADEFKDHGITVNAVLPGTIATEANRRAMPEADTTRWVTPEEVAWTILFLLSDLASGVNGASIRVTGRG